MNPAHALSSLLEDLLADGTGLRRFLRGLAEAPTDDPASADAIQFVEQLAPPERPLHTGPVEAARRTDVEVAVGILVATLPCSPKEAMSTLRRSADHAGLDVEQVALAVVVAAEAGRPPYDDPPEW